MEEAGGAQGGEASRAVALESTLSLCNELLERGAPGIYMYTLNLEKTAKDLVGALPALAKTGSAACKLPLLPFPRARSQESVRPIFWASNPLTYLAKQHGGVVGWGTGREKQGGVMYSSHR